VTNFSFDEPSESEKLCQRPSINLLRDKA